jgi:hypothetical protein
MRVIRYPEPEIETFVTCSKCKAELAYVGSDCQWRDGFSGDIKYIVCPCCNNEIKIDYTPYPINIGDRFSCFNDGSWATEVKL